MGNLLNHGVGRLIKRALPQPGRKLRPSRRFWLPTPSFSLLRTPNPNNIVSSPQMLSHGSSPLDLLSFITQEPSSPSARASRLKLAERRPVGMQDPLVIAVAASAGSEYVHLPHPVHPSLGRILAGGDCAMSRDRRAGRRGPPATR